MGEFSPPASSDYVGLEASDARQEVDPILELLKRIEIRLEALENWKEGQLALNLKIIKMLKTVQRKLASTYYFSSTERSF